MSSGVLEKPLAEEAVSPGIFSFPTALGEISWLTMVTEANWLTMEKPTYTITPPKPPTVEGRRDRPVDLFQRALVAVTCEAGENYVNHPRLGTDGTTSSFRYVYNGEPDCLVGRVLSRMGISTTTLSAHEGDTAQRVVGAVWDTHPSFTGDDYARAAVSTAATMAQMVNDNMMPWGRAMVSMDAFA